MTAGTLTPGDLTEEVTTGIWVTTGDARHVVAGLPPASVHAVITDPPYGYRMRGETWDDPEHAATTPTFWADVLRVLRPGGHVLTFGGPRTWHRVAVAVEDAGLEIRTTLAWLHAEGYPTGMNVSKAIDRHHGATRARVGPGRQAKSSTVLHPSGYNIPGWRPTTDTPTTDDAAQWRGWHTSLKPQHEPLILARAPLDGTIARTVLTHRTGALNVDATRYGDHIATRPGGLASWFQTPGQPSTPTGEPDRPRWPGDVLMDTTTHAQLEDTYGVSRFFYCAKADTTERVTVDGRPPHVTVKPLALMRWLVRLITPPGGHVLDPFAGSGTTLLAALTEGMTAHGVEREPDHVDIIRARLTAPAPVVLF